MDTWNCPASHSRPEKLFSTYAHCHRKTLQRVHLHRRSRSQRHSKLKSSVATRNESDTPSVQRWFHTLEDGLRLEVLSLEVANPKKPPLIFIHGAGHGAWCWKEYFMPFFWDKGYTCFAISLRSQAGSDVQEGAKAGGTLEQHAQDLSHFIAGSALQTPFLIGHSFGGLVVGTYALCGYEARPRLAGFGLLASSPLCGSDKMLSRFWKRSIINCAQLTWAFVTKSYLRRASEAQKLFFSDDLPEDDLDRFFKLLQLHRSPVPAVHIDKLKEELPLPAPGPETPPAFVLGAEDDRIVDVEGVQENAAHLAAEAVMLPRMAHDVMLDTRWVSAAEALEEWCASGVVGSSGSSNW